MELEPATLALAERYKLLIGAIVPRPIAFVSTVGPDGRANLAPFSFFTAIASHPMTLLFCPANKPDGTEKDTLRNASPAPTGTGQFVVNIVSEAFERRMAACAEELPFGESEFALSGLSPGPSRVITPPRVAESPISFECETLSITRLAPGEPAGGNIVIGRVVWVHASEGLLNERMHVDPERLGAIGRMGGLMYCRTHDRFEMPMGRAALNP